MTDKKDFMPIGYLTGQAYYASVHNPNTKFEKKFVLQLALDGEELDKAKKMNLRIKSPSEYVPKPHVEVKRVVRGPQTKNPTVIDGLNQPLDKNVMIGNGSTVKVKFGLYDNKKGNMGAYMDTVKLIKLVKFEGRGGEESEFMAVTDTIEGVQVDSEMDDEIPFETTPKKPTVKAKVTTTG